MPTASKESPGVALEKPEKSRSVWDLLLQMRVLLPYLSRVLPLLEGAGAKIPPDLRGLRQSVAELQSESRSLEAGLSNQSRQMERMEGQLAEILAAGQNSLQENRRLRDEITQLRRLFVKAGLVFAVLLLLLIILVAALLIRY